MKKIRTLIITLAFALTMILSAVPLSASAATTADFEKYCGLFFVLEDENVTGTYFVTFISADDGSKTVFVGPSLSSGQTCELFIASKEKSVVPTAIEDVNGGVVYSVTESGVSGLKISTDKSDITSTVYIPYFYSKDNKTLSFDMEEVSAKKASDGSISLNITDKSKLTKYTGIINTNGNVVGILLPDSNGNVPTVSTVLNIEDDSTPEPTEDVTSGYGTDDIKDDEKGHIGIYGALLGAVVAGLVVLIIKSKGNNNSNPDQQIAINRDVNDLMPNQYSDDGRRVCIEGVGGEFDGRKFELTGSLTIGRISEKCNICYSKTAKGISGLHCKLEKVGNNIELTDLGSSYGTFVNGSPVAANVPITLSVGDSFYLADPKNTFKVYS